MLPEIRRAVRTRPQLLVVVAPRPGDTGLRMGWFRSGRSAVKYAADAEGGVLLIDVVASDLMPKRANPANPANPASHLMRTEGSGVTSLTIPPPLRIGSDAEKGKSRIKHQVNTLCLDAGKCAEEHKRRIRDAGNGKVRIRSVSENTKARIKIARKGQSDAERPESRIKSDARTTKVVVPASDPMRKVAGAHG